MARITFVACLILVLVPSLIHAAVIGSLDTAHLQAGVVKITSRSAEGIRSVGTGFIVRLDRDAVYILTAAHVVASDQHPLVEFFTKQNVPLPATVVHKEATEEVTSLALLILQGKETIPSGLTALSIASATGLSEGDDIIVIGHPREIGDWAILGGKAAKRRGRNVVVDANIEEGNSGGPMIKNGEVVGLVAGRTRYGLAVTSGSIRDYLDGHRIFAHETAPPSMAKVLPAPSVPVKPESRHDRGEREIVGKDGPPMVMIPAGEFWMGSPDGQGGPFEHPAHKVRFAKPFAMARYETTFEEYDRFAQATGRSIPGDAGFGRGRRPVINVSWKDAKDYAEWLSQQTGKNYRLPTEAEWEYAARSGGKNDIWAGTSDESQLERYAVYTSKGTEPVGGKKSNGLELHDMSGNVYEWVEDCWHDNYKEAPNDGTAWGQAGGGNCGLRVIRGGSWGSIPSILRASGRIVYPPDFENDSTGFRLVQELE